MSLQIGWGPEGSGEGEEEQKGVREWGWGETFPREKLDSTG